MMNLFDVLIDHMMTDQLESIAQPYLIAQYEQEIESRNFDLFVYLLAQNGVSDLFFGYGREMLPTNSVYGEKNHSMFLTDAWLKALCKVCDKYNLSCYTGVNFETIHLTTKESKNG